MMSGRNSPPVSAGQAPPTNIPSFSILAGDPFSVNGHQLWPNTAEYFPFRRPSLEISLDGTSCETEQSRQHDLYFHPPKHGQDHLQSPRTTEVSRLWGRSRDINERPTPSPQGVTLRRELPMYPHYHAYQRGQHWPSSQGGYFGLQEPSFGSQRTPLEYPFTMAPTPNEAPQDTTCPQPAPNNQSPASSRRQFGSSVTTLLASAPPPKSQRCFECCFAHKSCTISKPGSRCDRCTRMYEKMRGGLKHSKLLNLDSSLRVDLIVFCDMRSTQKLLTCLRGAAEAVTDLRPGVTLESCFRGSIVCHMDNRIVPFSSFSVTGVPVVLKHLATTQTALELAESQNQEFPLPGLDDVQMDRFIDASNRMRGLQELHQSEKAILITAIRCSDLIGILFNWDVNAVCFESIDSLPQAKNLVLETAYAMAYRIQQLLMILCREVNCSLTGTTAIEDPATIVCALRIVYQSISCFQKLKWDTGSLKDLGTFLNRLRERAPAALRSLDRYRVNMAFLRCGQKSQNVKAMQALIDTKKTPKGATSFTYQQHRTDINLLFLPRTCYYKTYTEVLESSMVNWGTFDTRPIPGAHFDDVELRTMKNSQMSGTTHATSPVSMVELLKQDESSTSKSSARSMTSACGTDFEFDTRSNYYQETIIPSLTVNPEETLATHDRDILRTEAWLESLAELQSSYFTRDVDLLEDWIKFEEQNPALGEVKK